MMTNFQTGCSRKFSCARDAPPLSAMLARRPMSRGRPVWRLLACAMGLILFPSAGAWADAPMGSPYVPLDSWVYPALDRLAGLGAINSQFVGLRPWTRIQCAQLVVEAEENLAEADANGA